MILTIYLSAVGFFGLILMGIDKHRAKRHQWRIPEKTLFLSAILGDQAGNGYLYRLRHSVIVYGSAALNGVAGRLVRIGGILALDDTAEGDKGYAATVPDQVIAQDIAS